MKYSKVEHTRSAVSVKHEVSGILYGNPEKRPEGHKDLKAHVETLVDKAKKLYTPFFIESFNFTEEKDVREKAKMLAGLFNSLSKEMLKKDSINEQAEFLHSLPSQRYYDKGKSKIFGSYESGLNEESYEKLVDDLITFNLRKTLRWKKSASVIKAIMLCMGNMDTYEEKISEISDTEMEYYLKILQEDYSKENTMKKVIKSIESQHVKVQVKKTDGGTKLQLASAEHSKKGEIFRWIKAYTNSGQETQKSMMISFRRLIVLYYSGVEAYRRSEENGITEWSFGSFLPEASEKFNMSVVQLIVEREQEKDKNKRKLLDRQIKELLHADIAAHYQEAVRNVYLEDGDKFWLAFIEGCAEKFLVKKPTLNPIKLDLAYLYEHTWKEWISFIAMKYVDMGKAVYHFAMGEPEKVSKGEPVSFGTVADEYSHGITSFDYEKVKAEESLNREFAQYVAFAVQVFANAACTEEYRNKGNNNEDVLSYKKDNWKKGARADAVRRILQFFGGQSTWKNHEVSLKPLDVIEPMQSAIASIRNRTYHYANPLENREKGSALAIAMLKKEQEEIGAVYRKKWYSNNVPMFYSVATINQWMDALYDSAKIRPAQVPAFDRVINKKNIYTILSILIKGKCLSKATRAGAEKYYASLNFVLKEMYYYGFLQDGRAKGYIVDALEKRLKDEEKNANNKDIKDRQAENNVKAMKNFKARIADFGNTMDFGGFCQQIMTDYNMQNRDKDVHKNDKGDELYKHYRMLLYIGIRDGFIAYLKESEIFSSVREPDDLKKKFENISKDEFCKGWDAHTFDNVVGKAKSDGRLANWYLTSHFLPPKQLNHLIGSIKSYIQYIEDVERRSASTGNPVKKMPEEEKKYYGDLLEILDFVKLNCGQTSNEVKDYFSDDEDYAKHLSRFVNIANKKADSFSTALQAFCAIRIPKSPTGRIGIYCDEMNPIVNRNIVNAAMYGNLRLMQECLIPIGESEIRSYYSDMANLDEVFQRGYCNSAEEQKNLRKFQQEKNRIEMVDVLTYTEIVNDLMGQLISWSYMRERDLMYFQLGYHYLEVYYGDKYPADHKYRSLVGDGVNISDGAILYQIVAMNTYELPMIYEEEGKVSIGKSELLISEKVKSFAYHYADEPTYNAGLCFFETVAGYDEHGDIVKTRNYIDHGKYYFGKVRKSLLDLYSEVYDRFFLYDTKLKKSVSFVLKNVLMNHFVKMDITMENAGMKTVKKNGEQRNIYSAKFSLVKDEKATHQVWSKEKRAKIEQEYWKSKGLRSEMFTCKIPVLKDNAGRILKNEAVKVEVYGDLFLEQLRKILEYGTSLENPAE